MKAVKRLRSLCFFLCATLLCACMSLAVSFTSVFNAKAATTESIKCDGASIRVPSDETDTKSGIRFHIRIDIAGKDANVVLDGVEYTQDEFKKIRAGIVVIPTNMLSGELTVETKNSAKNEENAWKQKEKNGQWYLEKTVYIYNIPATSYEREFSFRGYYVNDNGTEDVTDDTYVYTQDTQSRSVAYVAVNSKYYKEDEAWVDEPYKTAALNGFLPVRTAVASKLVNVDKYLYRVGNGNTFNANSLFDYKKVVDSIAIDATVECECISGTVEFSYTTIDKCQFSGTGIAKLTITDKYSSASSELTVEVIDAKNATGAASANSNNVVLLNDVAISTIEVSNGYTLYGNGFKMTAANDVAYYQWCGFVHVTNGALDNVQIIVPNCSYAILYDSNKKDSGNKIFDQGDSARETYGNMRSAIMTDGNATISNSYVSGGRSGIFVRSGNVIVENTTIYGGAVANILVNSLKDVVLRDMTLVQEPIQATVYDTSKTLMGFGVLAICGDDGLGANITLEGELTQYAWVNSTYKKYAPSEGQSLVQNALEKTAYIHSITYDDGVTRDSLNLGIAYMQGESKKTSEPTNIVDDRTNKSSVPYSPVFVSVLGTAGGWVYSYENSKGTQEGFKNKPAAYQANAQGQNAVAPVLEYTDMQEGMTWTTAFDGDENGNGKGWYATLSIDLDVMGDYTFKFANLVAKKFGKVLSYTVSTGTGNIILNDTGTKELVLTVEDDACCDITGNEPAVHTLRLTIVSTKTSIVGPEKVAEPGGTPLMVVKAKNSDWSCAIPALEGTQIKYYNKQNRQYETLALSSLTPTNTGKQNDENNYWELKTDNYTLKVSCGYIHDTKKVYGMPVVVNNGGNKMYFTISSTNGYVSTSTTSRSVTISYEFTDANGNDTLKFSKTWSFLYSDYSSKQYSYSDFVKGTLKEASSGTCLVEGTLVTLADGTQKKIEDVTMNDQVLVFNHETGKYEAGKIWFSDHANDPATLRNVINLVFSNGTVTRISYEHGFFDLDLNKYIFIDESNMAEYIGHRFYTANYTGADFVGGETTLVDAYITEEVVKVYGPITEYHFNMVSDGLLSMPSFNFGVRGFINIFEYGEDLKYDEEKMQADIEEYGLFTYDDFKDYMSYEDFCKAPITYFKISIAKGYLTYEEIELTLQYLYENGFAE